MADDKSKKGKLDRNRVASNEGYEVSYFVSVSCGPPCF